MKVKFRFLLANIEFDEKLLLLCLKNIIRFQFLRVYVIKKCPRHNDNGNWLPSNEGPIALRR